MKALVLILGLFLIPTSSLATEVSYGDFVLLSHLNLAFCSDFGQRADTDILYYTGLAEVLNDYVSAKVAEGALQPKKVEIKIACHTAVEAGPSIVEVSQNRRGYYIVIVQDVKPDLYQLVRIIDYFADKRWKSFCHDKWARKVSPQTAFRTFNRILDETVGKPDLSFFAGRREMVFQEDELRVVYEADQLFYEMAGQRLDLQAGRSVAGEIERPLSVRKRRMRSSSLRTVKSGGARACCPASARIHPSAPRLIPVG